MLVNFCDLIDYVHYLLSLDRGTLLLWFMVYFFLKSEFKLNVLKVNKDQRPTLGPSFTPA